MNLKKMALGVLLLGMVLLTCLITFLVMDRRGNDIVEADTGSHSPSAQSLQRELDRMRPKGLYIVIDTAMNRLYLKRGDEVLIDAACSTGSGKELVSGDRSWKFRTPRGEFRVQNKIPNPMWRKPDWAFLEEGEPVPTKEAERLERGVLGEYALGIGDGYFIHGTLYNRLLGKNVTHGCVRLASPDLIKLAETVPIGTRVYIF